MGALFNKQHRRLLFEFKKAIEVRGICPVIFKHIYNPSYLINKLNEKEIIIARDRDVVKLNNLEKQFLTLIQNKPRESMVYISNSLNIDPKTAVRIRKKLKQKKVIQKYTINLNYEELKLFKSNVMIQLDYRYVKEIDKFLIYAKENKNITAVTKLIGKYELFVTIESDRPIKHVIKDIRDKFYVGKYNIVDSEGVYKSISIPEVYLNI